MLKSMLFTHKAWDEDKGAKGLAQHGYVGVEVRIDIPTIV